MTRSFGPALLLVLLVLGVVLLVYHSRTLASMAFSNAGWLALNRQLVQEPSDLASRGAPQKAFTRAGALSAANDSAWFGQGLAYAVQGNPDEAIALWARPDSEPQTLIEYGLIARENGAMDVALTEFRAAAELLGVAARDPAGYLAGTICQRTLALGEALSAANRQYCANYWQANGGNLIVNGAFPDATATAWQGEHYFMGGRSARWAIEPGDADGDPAARLQGRDDSNHFGLFQRLSLAPGDTVRFSGRFKMTGEESLRARLLYVGWQNANGRAEGNHAEVRQAPLDWTVVEREFTVPANSEGNFDFYPVLFSGVGDVWFDDIELQIIPQ